ncbi:MAG: N,N-dimethylformamidase beta subunit family domain-containing protein, partial [Isosphaeraceae bacterium]
MDTSRRDLLKTMTGLALAAVVEPSAARADDSPAPQVQPAQPNLIRDENRKPGASDWQLTRVRLDKDGFRSPWIEGYASKQSVEAGESIDLLISTNPARRFGIEIFRMGYYGGKGARLMTTLGPFEGKPQTSPALGPKNLHECQWEPTTKLTIPADWP